MTRDLRDPEVLGHLFRAARFRGDNIEDAVNQRAPLYEDKPWISANPAEHHSKTPQTVGDMTE